MKYFTHPKIFGLFMGIGKNRRSDCEIFHNIRTLVLLKETHFLGLNFVLMFKMDNLPLTIFKWLRIDCSVIRGHSILDSRQYYITYSG